MQSKTTSTVHTGVKCSTSTLRDSSGLERLRSLCRNKWKNEDRGWNLLTVLAVCYQCSKYFTGVNLELLTTSLWYKCYRYLHFIDEERRPRVVEYLHWIPWNQDLGKGTLVPEPKLSYTLYSVQGGLKEKKYLRKCHAARASMWPDSDHKKMAWTCPIYLFICLLFNTHWGPTMCKAEGIKYINLPLRCSEPKEGGRPVICSMKRPGKLAGGELGKQRWSSLLYLKWFPCFTLHWNHLRFLKMMPGSH